MIAVELLTIFVTLKFLRSLSSAPLATNIYIYRSQLAFGGTERVSPPQLFNVLRIVTSAIGYYVSYLVVRIYLSRHKINWLCVVTVILSVISSLLTGGRGGMFITIFSIIFFYYLIHKQGNDWHYNAISKNFKKIIIAVCILAFTVFLFQDIAILLGRNITTSQFDYLAEYFGAEFKNLDIFITTKAFPVRSGISGSQTFYYLWKMINKVITVPGSDLPLDLPFNAINGYDLGNVATTFYPYLYDFGLSGIVTLVAIMAMISEYFYQHIKYLYLNQHVSVLTLIYGVFISNSLIYAFFSNQFYERLFSSTAIYTVIIWFLLNVYLFHFSVRDKRNL